MSSAVKERSLRQVFVGPIKDSLDVVDCDLAMGGGGVISVFWEICQVCCGAIQVSSAGTCSGVFY